MIGDVKKRHNKILFIFLHVFNMAHCFLSSDGLWWWTLSFLAESVDRTLQRLQSRA